MTELLDNTYDLGPMRGRNVDAPLQPMDVNAFDVRTGAPRAGISIHITPTKRTRHQDSSYRHQGYCLICGMKTIYQCSKCAEDGENQSRSYICHSKTGRTCFPDHVEAAHA